MPVPDLFAEGLARGWKTYNGSRLDDDLELEADVVVVGTGAGGGTTAEILSAAGLKVLLVEEEGFELVDFLLALLQVGDIGDHGLAPRRSVGGCVAARLSLWRTWFGPMNFAASLDF